MLKRQTADHFVELIRERAEEVNRGPYAYRVKRIEVFGSYLTDKQDLGDLDVLVTLRPRYAEQSQFEALAEDRRRAAEQAGRAFPLHLNRIYWPTEEVHRALRRRNRTISIHHDTEREPLARHGATFQTIYEEE
jgi:predicted nucleotidyltransferase